MAFYSKHKLVLGLVFAFILLLGTILSFGLSKNNEIACTTEAKLCPDGSAVGRTGPLCEFAKCPGGGNGGTVGEFWGNILGNVLLGPTCPVMMDPPDPRCADRPYQTQLVLTTVDQLRVIKEFSSDKDGKFNIEVPPGEYIIRSAAAANILPYCASNNTIKVNANTSVEVTVGCDTGIR
ncbi:MAG: hypothetical protein Q8O71_02970 [bacterium]|nr:hypothetical protein [bacterium]